MIVVANQSVIINEKMRRRIIFPQKDFSFFEKAQIVLKKRGRAKS